MACFAYNACLEGGSNVQVGWLALDFVNNILTYSSLAVARFSP
jgi:hypothetical protein